MISMKNIITVFTLSLLLPLSSFGQQRIKVNPILDDSSFDSV
jgi:hypothetical protein